MAQPRKGDVRDCIGEKCWKAIYRETQRNNEQDRD
jgi:hypothetical protein